MAEIIAKFNTKTKELTITMDGTAVDNVMGVHLSKSYSYSDSESDPEEFCCCITTVDKSKTEDGYQTYTQISAAETAEGKKALSEGGYHHSTFKEFVVGKILSPVQSATRKFLKRIIR